MAYFKEDTKYNIKEKLICYRKRLYSLNTLIKTIIKLDNKFYKRGIKICYSNQNCLIKV